MKTHHQKRKRYCSRLPSLLVSLIALTLALSITVSAVSIEDGTLQVSGFYGITAYDMWNDVPMRFYDGTTWYETTTYAATTGLDFYDAIAMVNIPEGYPSSLGLFSELGNNLDVSCTIQIPAAVNLNRFQIAFGQEVTILAGDQIEFYIAADSIGITDLSTGDTAYEVFYLEYCYGYDEKENDVLRFEALMQTTYKDRSYVGFRSERLYEDITVQGLSFYPPFGEFPSIGNNEDGVEISCKLSLSPVVMGPLDSLLPSSWKRYSAGAIWGDGVLQSFANNGYWYNLDPRSGYPSWSDDVTSLFYDSLSTSSISSTALKINTSRLYFDMGDYVTYYGVKTATANGYDFSTFEIRYPVNFTIPAGQQVEFYIRAESFYWVKDSTTTRITYFDQCVGDINGSSDDLSFELLAEAVSGEWVGFRSSVASKDITISYLTFSTSQITSGSILAPFNLYFRLNLSPVLVGELDSYPSFSLDQLDQIQIEILQDVVNELRWVGIAINGLSTSIEELTDAILDDTTGEDPPDYGAITGDPSYDIGGQIGEDEAVVQLGNLQDGANIALSDSKFGDASDFWQDVFALIFSIEAVGCMVTVVSVMIVIRSLVGR